MFSSHLTVDISHYSKRPCKRTVGRWWVQMFWKLCFFLTFHFTDLVIWLEHHCHRRCLLLPRRTSKVLVSFTVGISTVSCFLTIWQYSVTSGTETRRNTNRGSSFLLYLCVRGDIQYTGSQTKDWNYKACKYCHCRGQGVYFRQQTLMSFSPFSTCIIALSSNYNLINSVSPLHPFH